MTDADNRAALRRARIFSSRSWLEPALPLSVTACGLLLAAIVLIQSVWSIRLILQPSQLDNAEALVHDHAARLVRGEPLYQPLDRPPYTVAGYTPLYYWLAGVLQAVMGPGFGPGRVLSFLAGLVAASLVAYLTTARAHDRRAGAFAAVLFLALGLPGQYLWSALYRVDLVGIALALGAVVTLLGGTSWRRVVTSGLLVALAILTKQTLLAAGAAAVIWLWRRDRRKSAIFAGSVLAIVLPTGVTLEATTGAFVANTVSANLNPFDPGVFAYHLVILALFQGGPLAVAMLYLRDRSQVRGHLVDDLLVLYWLASFLPVLGLAKVGSSQNYWIELAAITAVLATLGLWRRLEQRSRLPLRLLGMSLAASVSMVIALVLFSVYGPWSMQQRADPSGGERFMALIEHVRSEPRDVLADPADVVTLAGRPNVFEPYIFSILHHQGRWNAEPFVRRICGGEIGLLVLNYPLDSPGPSRFGQAPHWPPPILAALQETMVLESEQAGRFMYAPRQDPRSVACNT